MSKLLDQLKPCDNCGKPVSITFYKLTIQHYVVDVNAVQRFMGLTMMLGGHDGIADALSPDTEFVKTADELKHEKIICEECYIRNFILHAKEE